MSERGPERLEPGQTDLAAAMSGFMLTYDGFDPGREGLREALTSTGNGYLCSRGTAEWEDADGVHYPGTYVHGVTTARRRSWRAAGIQRGSGQYAQLAGPKLRIEGGEAIRLADVELLDYRHELDIRYAAVVPPGSFP